MLLKKTRRLISLLTAMILVWSQISVAAYACQQLAPSEPPSAAMESAMSEGCVQVGQMDNKSSPLCKAHCAQVSQSSQTPALNLPPLVLVAILEIPRFNLVSLQPVQYIHDDFPPLTDGSPPLRIQYQVFRI